MKIYVDLVLFLNIIMDFLLLLTVSIVLKRNVRIYRIILGSLIGGLSILFLFIKLNNISLFLFKTLISILMVLITFSYKNFKYFFNNLIYLYLSSIILGGGIYLLDIQINYRNNGLMFISNGMEINVIVLLIISPFIIYSYIKSMKKMKINFNNYYKVDVYYKDNTYKFNAYLDTGNKLYDPYKKRPIILVSTNKINIDYEKSILVPYETASGQSILKCFVANKIVIDKKYEVKNVLIGITNFKMEGIDMLLNNEIIGGIK